MDIKALIVNAGIRFDYFEPDGKIPTDFRDPDPHNPIKQREVWFKRAKPKIQFSPRFGLAFPITERGVFHASYGHFFQIPNFEYLYVNSEFEIPPQSYVTLGNADLKPQKTVIYEVGLQQQLTENLAVSLTAYAKDIRNLLGTELHELYIVVDRYARYINRDYGFVRGFTIALKKRPSHNVSATVDYTFQIAKGNASDPNAVFLDNQAIPPIEPEKQMVPLDWDRTHSLNMTVTIGDPKGWNLSLIGKFGSGFPYTAEYKGFRFPENAHRKPDTYSFDLYAYKNFQIFGLRYSLFMKVYNLFDRRNELTVYGDTGRATTNLEPQYRVHRATGTKSLYSLEECYTRPDFYSGPRRVILGISIEF